MDRRIAERAASCGADPKSLDALGGGDGLHLTPTRNAIGLGTAAGVCCEVTLRPSKPVAFHSSPVLRASGSPEAQGEEVPRALGSR